MNKVKVTVQTGSFLKLSQECASSSLKIPTQGTGAFYTLNEKIRISYAIYKKVMACLKTPNQNPHEQGGESQRLLTLDAGSVDELLLTCHIFKVYNKPVLL